MSWGGYSLTKKAAIEEPKREQYALRSGLVKEYASDRYYRQNAQQQRWLAEHQRHEAVEKALADVSKLRYEREDYVRFLVKEPFKEPVRQEFQSLLPERLLMVERTFRRPINIRWGLIAALILSVALFPGTITFILVVIMVATLSFLQFRTIRKLQSTLEKIEKDTRLEIECMVRAQEEVITQQRRIHEDAEEERIEFYVRLLNGDLSAAIMTIDEYLPKLVLPFPLDVDLDLQGSIIRMKAWLPAKMIIPTERTSLAESGKIQYEKKESIQINKQYAELCAAILMQLSAVLFAKIPTLGKLYVAGMNKDGGREECIIAMIMDRSQMEAVSLSSTALVALQGLSAVYNCDEYLKLLPVEPLMPAEWQDVDPRNIRNMQVKIYQGIAPGMRNRTVDEN